MERGKWKADRDAIAERHMQFSVALMGEKLSKVKNLVENGNICSQYEYCALCGPNAGTVISRVLKIWYNEDQKRIVVSEEFMRAVLTMLVDAGVDINEPETSTSTDMTPLMLAILMEELPACEILLSLGADINTPSRDNPPSIHCGRYPFCRYHSTTALNAAVHAGPCFVTLLLQHGAHLTVQDDMLQRDSPLYLAVLWQHPRILEIFMDWYEQEPNRRFPWRNALSLALGNAHDDIIMVMLQKEYHLWQSDSRVLVASYFDEALKRGRSTIMHLLIKQQPQVLHTKRDLTSIDSRNYTLWTQHAEFMTKLKTIQGQPLSLKVQCRQRILQQLGPGPDPRIDQLHYPQPLRDYLKQNEVIPRLDA